uniref:PCI domain-containing protein n=1 Tax=Mesocestoides corti TaxID=53468 RepID=A0A5K3F2Z1_MESCO
MFGLRVLGVFVFSDLRDNAEIQSLAPESKLRNLLDLFCYGTYGDHKTAFVPELSPAQIRKLRQLTIISACDLRRLIPYDFLLKSLELTSLRELEDLIIDLFYVEALFGKLDQQKRMLVVDSAIGRDLRPDDLPILKSALYSWSNRVDSVLNDVALQVTKATILKKQWIESNVCVSDNQSNAQTSAKHDGSKSDIDSLTMDIDDHPDIYPEGSSGPSPPLSQLSPPSSSEKVRRSPLRVLQKGRKGGK